MYSSGALYDGTTKDPFAEDCPMPSMLGNR